MLSLLLACTGEVVGELAPAGANGTGHLANGFALEAAAVATDPLWPELEKQVGFLLHFLQYSRTPLDDS